MKKIKIFIVALITLFSFNISARAASGNLSVNSTNVYVGDSFTVSVNVSSMAAWNIHVSSSGPVSNCEIKQADATTDALDTNKTFSATCITTGTGIVRINLSGDVTSAEDGVAVPISGSAEVTVTEKPAPSNDTNNNTTQEETKKSSNNKIKELTVDGYNLVKVNDNNYTLTVTNNVKSIKINAKLDDVKSTVTGTGTHELKDGENNIEIIITAEDGTKNKINVKVTKKNNNTIEDLETVLKEDKNLNITIESNTKLSKDDVTKIKNSNKIVNLNYYDKDNKLIYSWIVDGSKLLSSSELQTSISFDSESEKEILKASNYSDGIIINVKEDKNVSNGVKIKLYVGDKFEDGNKVKLYGYVDNNLELIKEKIKVEKGYIEFEAGSAKDYLITMSDLYSSSDKVVTTGTTDNNNTSLIILIALLSAVVILNVIIIIRIIKKRKKVENQRTNNEINNVSSPTNSNIEINNTSSTMNNNIGNRLGETNSYTNIFTNR